MKHGLVVEDLPGTRAWLVDALLVAFPALEVAQAGTAAEALRHIAGAPVDLALVDLGLPDGCGTEVLAMLRARQPNALAVVVTIYDDDDHLFAALQAGAFGYLLKEQPREQVAAQLLRIGGGEPPLTPRIARRVLSWFRDQAPRALPAEAGAGDAEARLTDRESEVLQRVAKGFTLPEIAQQFGLSRHTVAGYVKQVYRKLNVSSRAEAALEASRRGLVAR